MSVQSYQSIHFLCSCCLFCVWLPTAYTQRGRSRGPRTETAPGRGAGKVCGAPGEHAQHPDGHAETRRQKRRAAVLPSEMRPKPAFLPAAGPPRCKSGHFGPFPAPGKLLPVFQIYFLFEPRPQKQCTAPPDDNGTGNRGLQVHLWPFSSHFHHFGAQNGGRYGFRCPMDHRFRLPAQFPIMWSTSVVWDQ